MKFLLLLSEFFLFERIGVLYAVTPLKRHGHDVLALQPQNMAYADLVRRIEAYSPDLVGYSVSTGEHNFFVELNRRLKQDLRFNAIFGGPHPTFFPEMIHEDGVDAICVGEGESALLDYLEALGGRGDPTAVAGVHVKREGAVFANAPRPLVMNLDDLPFPDRTILYDCDPKLKNFYMKTFYAARGCPRRCTFCYNHLVKELYPREGGKLRYRSPANFVEEIAQVKQRYTLHFVVMGDDNFAFKPKHWLQDFTDLYVSRINLPFACNVSANFAKPEIMSLLKDAGCHTVNTAFECADEFVNNSVLKKGVTRQRFQEAVRLAKEYGFVSKTMNIVGLPTRDPITVDLSTLDANIACRPDAVNATLLAPFPKLKITSYCKEHGFLPVDDTIYATFKTSNLDRAFLDYGDERINRQLERLQKLFPLIVRAPMLRPFARLLIKAPLTPLYKYLGILRFAWETHVTTVRGVPLRSYASLAAMFFKYLLYREKY